MHDILRNVIKEHIGSVARSACERIVVDMTADEAYEALLECYGFDTPLMIAAFQNAIKYMGPMGQHRSVTLIREGGEDIDVALHLYPTEKWRAFLIPGAEANINGRLYPEGKLAEKLALPIRVAQDWADLLLVFDTLTNERFNLTPEAVARLMPWVRDVLKDIGHITTTSKLARLNVEREKAKILDEVETKYIPRMSRELTAIARSGSALFGQYKMISAANPRAATATVMSVLPYAKPSPWIKGGLEEVLSDWKDDERTRLNERLSAKLDRALEKERAKLPPGTSKVYWEM